MEVIRSVGSSGAKSSEHYIVSSNVIRPVCDVTMDAAICLRSKGVWSHRLFSNPGYINTLANIHVVLVSRLKRQ